MAVKPYFNQLEYAHFYQKKDGVYKLKKMKSIADAGNVQAAYWFADKLMKGVWNLERMERDFACGRLIPPHKIPAKDAYILVPRNQNKAIDYFKIAASYPHESCDEVINARGILAYCRQKSEIRYSGKGSKDKIMCKKFEKQFSKASEEEIKMNPFMPYPFVRPEVLDPRTKMFINLADRISYLGALEILILYFCVFLTLLICGDGFNSSGSGFEVASFLGWLFVLTLILCTPLAVSVFVSWKYGSKQKLPICSCADIRKARENEISRLPEECVIVDEDPFENTPYFIRNNLTIKHITLSIYIFLAGTLHLLHSANFINLTETFPFWSETVSVALMILIYLLSTLFLIMEKSGFLTNTDCENELYKSRDEEIDEE